LTGNAKRSSGIVETSIEQIRGTDWIKFTPKEPSPSGEYGIMYMPQGQNLFATTVFDFAIDLRAPENTNPIMPKSDQ
jgi:hypothetical protein